MKLNDLMQKLIAVEPSGFPFLSIYLNAEPNEQGRDGYRIWLKTELSEQAKNYAEDSAEGQSFNADVERITKFLENEVEPAANGIAIYASFGADEFFETMQIEVTFPNNRLFVFDRPHIFPLARAVEQNPRYVAVWADTNKADIYIFGGERSIDVQTETKAQIEQVENPVTGRTKAGGWSQGRFQRRIENFHMLHAKEVAEVIEPIMRNGKIE